MAIMKRIIGMRLSGDVVPGDIMNWLRETGAYRSGVRRAVLKPPPKARKVQRTLFDEETPALETTPRPARVAAEPPFEPGFYRRRPGIMSYARQS